VNGLLAIAAGFLERMTNPQYGVEVNEEYSFRLHEALDEDPGFARSFATLALDPDDVETLPECAWPWYLQWREDNGAPLAPEFLDALFEYTDDPAVRLSVVRSAVFRNYPVSTQGAEPGGSAAYDEEEEAAAEESGFRFGDQAPTAGYDFPDRAIGSGQERPRPPRSPWLRMRTSRITDAHDRGRADASEIAAYLLQLGDPESLASLRALIGQRGPGREELVATVQRYITEANLDPETAAEWRRELGITAPGERA
jgi:hypothetical protein